MPPLSTMSLKNLHVVMGHLDFPDALQAAKAAGLRLTDTEQPFCETCALGKSTRASLPQAAEGKDVEPGQLIHTDFIGPFEESEVSGKRKFAILFLDHSTRWAKAYVLSHKSEALGAFKRFIEDMRALSPENPINIARGSTLQSDSGSEFLGANFSAFCKAQGIVQRASPAYSQALHGIVESAINVVQDMTRSMLIGANLHKSFWALALHHAVFVRNVSPTKALKGATPYSRVFGKEFNPGLLRAFGTQSFVHVPKALRQKLDPTARGCVRGVRLAHPRTRHLRPGLEAFGLIDPRHVQQGP